MAKMMEEIISNVLRNSFDYLKCSMRTKYLNVDLLQKLDTTRLIVLHEHHMSAKGLNAETEEELDYLEKNRATIRKILKERRKVSEKK